MGGGEVARYLGKFGSKDVSQAVFISSVPPFLLKTANNPEGVDGGVFDSTSTGEIRIPIRAKLPVEGASTFVLTAEQPGGVVVSDGPFLVVAAR